MFQLLLVFQKENADSIIKLVHSQCIRILKSLLISHKI